MKLSDKTILVVGASSGIGRIVALQLSKHNNRLIICARRETELKKLVEELEGNESKALSCPCDAKNKLAAASVVEKAVDTYGNIDAALLNLGAGPAFNMSRVTVDEVTENMELNYTTLVNFLVPLIAQMKSQKHGLIAHTNSLAGFLGLPMQGPYSSAKAACRILMDTCRIELKPFGIRFVSVYPGFVATERVADNGIPAPFEISEKTAARHIIKALTKEKSDYLFPFFTENLIRLALVLPKPVSSFLLTKAIPEDY
ncbi:SDR family NAD(P)-dependent oxidoreductase [bacterium]|nr:SDR family NAD(P)-dependent oxidoreductase [bacterium]